ncbi:hypothetical protein [uncultured Friedmanniella sp.]|uniref:hypothetical protein n=1 Tax=uncultured Friedmanniella sp. TaxID=335381 RepID=UPI0035CAC93E
MSPSPWRRVPLELTTDLEHGGRWASLRTATREWCWVNPRPDVADARLRVSLEDAFVDAGGVEECWPTVRGRPDHGDAWARTWSGAAEDASVVVPGVGRLRRRVTGGAAVDVGYEVTGAPGTPFLHAVHALLDLSPHAWIELPQARTLTLLDGDDSDPDPGERPWPSGLDRFGPDDGTAVCALVPRCSSATVVDGDDALGLEWWSDRPELCSLLLWRNLGGWPADGPYRSVGVEPLVGRAADFSTAAPGECATLDASGAFRWRLRVAALRRDA